MQHCSAVANGKHILHMHLEAAHWDHSLECANSAPYQFLALFEELEMQEINLGVVQLLSNVVQFCV